MASPPSQKMFAEPMSDSQDFYEGSTPVRSDKKCKKTPSQIPRFQTGFQSSTPHRPDSEPTTLDTSKKYANVLKTIKSNLRPVNPKRQGSAQKIPVLKKLPVAVDGGTPLRKTGAVKCNRFATYIKQEKGQKDAMASQMEKLKSNIRSPDSLDLNFDEISQISDEVLSPLPAELTTEFETPKFVITNADELPSWHPGYFTAHSKYAGSELEAFRSQATRFAWFLRSYRPTYYTEYSML